MLVPKQPPTVALGGEANPQAFGRALFHLGMAVEGGVPRGTFLKDFTLSPLRHLGLTIRMEGRVAA
jgi:hypothetical protein